MSIHPGNSPVHRIRVELARPVWNHSSQNDYFTNLSIHASIFNDPLGLRKNLRGKLVLGNIMVVQHLYSA
jgi:hypothetical protein